MKNMYDVYEEILSFGGVPLESEIIFSGTKEKCQKFLQKKTNITGAFTTIVYSIWKHSDKYYLDYCNAFLKQINEPIDSPKVSNKPKHYFD